MIFFTADLHFNHKAALQHSNRPFSSMEEMNEGIIDNWNKSISKKDTCYILGDFAWKEHTKFQGRLNGKKILVIGNHDKMNQKALANFTETTLIKFLNINKRHIILSHYPFRTWDRSHYGSWHLFGHTHGRLKTFNLSFDVGVDAFNYFPVPFELIEKIMIEREENMEKIGRIKIKNGIKKYSQDDVEWSLQRCVIQ